MGIAAAAAVGAVGAIGGAVISSGANGHAADVAAQSAAASNALSQQQYNSTKGLIQPYVDRGNVAADTLQGFLGLGGDPHKTQAAFDSFLNSTGYQFDRDQGVKAAEQSKAAEGLFNSGAALKSLDAFGTGLANSYGQQYVSDLNTVAARGVNAIGTLTGAGQNNVTNQTNNNTGAATAAGNAITANGKILSGTLNNLSGAVGTAIGGSSYGGGAGAGAGGYSTAFNQDGYAPFAYSGG